MEDKIVRFELANKIFKEMPEKAKLLVGNAQVEICFIGGLNIIVRVFYFDGKDTKRRAHAFGNDIEHINLVLNSFDTKLSQVEKELIGYEKDQTSMIEVDGFVITKPTHKPSKEITSQLIDPNEVIKHINQLPPSEAYTDE